METSKIQDFYKGARVFLTGGTGFMGKALIEKLLRDTEVETIYILVREKKGKTSHMRIDELFDDVVFERLKSQEPNCKNKVQPIAGDCSIAGLGLSIIDRQRLITDVDIVLHVAATVNFNQHIKLAYNINVRATRDVLDLAREMTNLKSIVHVSTAYSNCIRDHIEEKIYDVPLDSSDLEVMLDKMTKHESELYTETLLGEWPNTYTFTKALAESMVKNRGNGLPIGIFRPSIIISTYKEPVPGWIDNLYGPTGITAGTVSGIIRTALCDGEKIADLIPIDTCVAAILASTWDIKERHSKKNDDKIPVYNYVSSVENPLYWNEFLNINYQECLKWIPEKAIWYPTITITNNKYFYYLMTFLYHTFPALLFDLASLAVGGKPRLLSLYKKVHKFTTILLFFSTKEWSFSNKNVQGLWLTLNKSDRDLFPFSMGQVQWLTYLRNYTPGIRRYLLKESYSSLQQSQKRCKRLEIMHNVLKITLTGLLVNFGYFFVKSVVGLLLRPFS
ncbi:hypothetical protein GWI33_019312 [Rhynchophorus ferrugineus]|uniref:Fatty acyl-CoA reductase n=1 Tax=Rhynchophorus ferrugineus TaxID=354439 RepID=A0A834M764_RHYFE|nr:hypothetical protein GWI33_019312 [Rhynchophorus ferrugineus]